LIRMKGSTPDKSKRKPRFVRNRGIYMRRLGVKWRKSRGIGSRMRLLIGGKTRRPKGGYGSDRRARSIHPSGFREVIVSNLKELESVDPSNQAARISGKVGLMKRERILTRADELRIRVLNR